MLMDIFVCDIQLANYSLEQIIIIANAAEYDTFHLKLYSTIFGKKLNRFETKRTSVWFQINRKMLQAI